MPAPAEIPRLHPFRSTLRKGLLRGLLLVCVQPVWAQGTAASAATAGSVGLQPHGALSVQYRGAAKRLSAEQIAALPQSTTVTATPWTDGVSRFTGPLARDVLQAAGVRITPGMTVQAQALNGYTVSIPAQDFQRWPVVLAFSMDGKALTRRDKGPLWIIYPRDSDTVLQDAKYDHRWAWQLSQLLVSDAP